MSHTRRDIAKWLIICPALTACQTGVSAPELATSDHIEMFDPAVADLIDPAAKWEVLADGFGWSEGPTWDKRRQQLYFTDVPGNKAYVWKEGVGAEVFLDPSGAAATEGFREPGANGLLYVNDDTLILANHGKRAVEKLNLEDLSRTVLVDNFKGQKFNSPNDVILADNGDLYFSDPPYGLEGLNESPLKELPFNGVYRFSKQGELTRLTDQMTFPNGVALSPDNQRLYVAQSDPDQPAIFVIDVSGSGSTAPEMFFDMASFAGPDSPGLPDGFAMTRSGAMFVTGPGGVFIISKTGQALGRILTGSATANCTFGEDGRTLFITAHDRLLRIPTRERGLAWS